MKLIELVQTYVNVLSIWISSFLKSKGISNENIVILNNPMFDQTMKLNMMSDGR